MLSGQLALRTHLPDNTALNTTCFYDSFEGKWFVKVKLWPSLEDPHAAIELVEPLDEFPSEVMIAQAMLVA